MSRKVTLALLPIAGMFIAPVSAANDVRSGWVLEREDGLGRETMYADPKGVKITYPKIGLNIMSKPPAWDVIWFNTRSRQQYLETLARYRSRKGLSITSGPPLKFPEVKKLYAGIKSREIQVVEAPGKKLLEVPFLSRVNSSDKVTVLQSNYYVSDDCDLPDGALVFLSTFFGTPNFGGIPLGCEQKLSSGVVARYGYAISAKRVVAPASTFASPVGYVTVKDPVQLNNGGFTAKMEDLMKDMKIGEDFGK